eukprot:760919-Amphidinium_carterae.2
MALEDRELSSAGHALGKVSRQDGNIAHSTAAHAICASHTLICAIHAKVEVTATTPVDGNHDFTAQASAATASR